MLSETRINELQKDLLELYEEIENDLLVSISSRFSINDIDGGTAEWHAEKLAELGAVTNENKKIIASKSGRTQKEVDNMFTSMGIETVEDDEKVYVKALERGYLTATPPPIDQSNLEDHLRRACFSRNYGLVQQCVEVWSAVPVVGEKRAYHRNFFQVNGGRDHFRLRCRCLGHNVSCRVENPR